MKWSSDAMCGSRRNVLLLAGSILLTTLSACSPTTPVDEISVESSGMQVYDQETSLAASDWPAWRGPGTEGVAIDQPIVTQWDTESNIVWATDVAGRGHSSPVVVGDHVFLTTALEDTQQQSVLAFERLSGELLWTTIVHEGNVTNQGSVHQKSSYANGTVACDGKLVFAAFMNASRIFVTALDVDGNVVWQTDVGPFRSLYGYAPSPILYRSCLVVAAEHIEGGYLAALDRRTGKIVWRTQRPPFSSYSSPVVAQVAGKPQLLISGCDQVASFQPDTGKLHWSCAGTTESTCGTMVTDGTNVFANGGYPGRETICVRGDGSGDVVWRNKTKIYEPSLLLAGDYLFAVTDEGIAYCWTAATGKQQWRQRLGGSFSASPVLCNGLILVSNLKGETFVFEATGSDYRQVAKNQLGDDCYTSFAVSHGQLFTRVGVRMDDRRQERLYCIGTRQGEVSKPQ